MSLSSAGRLSFVPEMPVSMNSRTSVQPRARQYSRRSRSWLSQVWSLVLTRQYKATRFTGRCPPLERSLLGAQNGRRALPRAALPAHVVLPPGVGLGFALPGPRSPCAPISLEKPRLLSPSEGRADGPRHRLHGPLHWRDDASPSGGAERAGRAGDRRRLVRIPAVGALVAEMRSTSSPASPLAIAGQLV